MGEAHADTNRKLGPVLEAMFEDQAESFLDRYWPGQHFVHHGDPRRLAGIHDRPELVDVFAALEGQRDPVKATFMETEGRYRQMPIRKEQGEYLYRAGMTLALWGLHRRLPSVGRWTAQLVEALGLPTGYGTCKVYASPPGAGINIHFDDHEVIVVQLHGRKRWRLAENESVVNPSKNYVYQGHPIADEMRLYCKDGIELPRRTRGVVMEPGSVLFVPRGTWHATEALDHSLSLTFALYPPTWLDILLDAIKLRFIHDARWRAPAAHAFADTARADEAAEVLQGLVGELLHELSEGGAAWLTARELIASAPFATQAKQRARHLRDPNQIYDQVQGVVVEVDRTPQPSHAAHVRVIGPGDSETHLHPEGAGIQVFDWISKRASFRYSELVATLPDAPVDEALKALVEAGALRTRDDRSHVAMR